MVGIRCGADYVGPLYPFGVGRGLALEQSWVLFVEPDQLDEVFDSEVGERLDAVFSDALTQMTPSSISISLAMSHSQSSSSPSPWRPW